jgi:uncharacterized protein
MILYLDTSALVKLYIAEEHSPVVLGWLQECEITGTSILARTEFAAALARLQRTGAFSAEETSKARAALAADWQDLVRLPVDETTVLKAEEVAVEHALRGYDAVHLAAALLWQDALRQPVTLATFDRNLAEAALSSGLIVLP